MTLSPFTAQAPRVILSASHCRLPIEKTKEKTGFASLPIKAPVKIASEGAPLP